MCEIGNSLWLELLDNGTCSTQNTKHKDRPFILFTMYHDSTYTEESGRNYGPLRASSSSSSSYSYSSSSCVARDTNAVQGIKNVWYDSLDGRSAHRNKSTERGQHKYRKEAEIFMPHNLSIPAINATHILELAAAVIGWDWYLWRETYENSNNHILNWSY
jgi:hypothetical protein